MALKKSLWNFQCGNKGAIFLLDITIAIFIVAFVLAVSLFFITRSEESSVSKLQATRIADDIFAVLDYTSILRKVNVNEIESEIKNMIPEGYSMDFKIECENRIYDSRSEARDNYLIGGERVFVDSQLNNCIARYWIWTD